MDEKFARTLQIQKIFPVYKKGDICLIENYRPIAILSTFSKIFEKIVANRLTDYMLQHKLLSECQYGFRPSFTTELAISKLCQSMYHALDSKSIQISVFCDLSKAFDTIDHSILLHKLKIYGIQGQPYE